MASRPAVSIVEFTDPWCSWAWGSEPKLRLLRWRHSDRLVWRRVMADLLARPEPDETRSTAHVGGAEGPVEQVAAYWKHVSEHTRMPWPERLRWVPNSSDVAGRAVTAARTQGEDLAERLLRALRESLFLLGTPADTPDRVLALAGAVPGLDAPRLAAELDSPPVIDAYAADRAETRRPNDYVLNLAEIHEGSGNARPDGKNGWRYATPTLIFRGPGGEVTVPGWQSWERYEQAMELVLPGSTTTARARPSPEDALRTWPTLTATELDFLCGPGARPGGGATPSGRRRR